LDAMAASSFGTQLALLFTFVFQVQGELVVQSDNVTFPPYADLPAMFGPPVPAGEERLWGVLKEANPLDACEPLKPPSVIGEMGWVALIKRSTNGKHEISPGDDNCSFVRKVIRAQEAGAIAAIVFDDEEEPLKRMAPMPWDPMLQPEIPSVFVSLRSGQQLQKLIELSSNPETDPIVFFLSGKQLKWISIFTSTTVGILAIGTVMVLFVFAKYQHGAGFGFPPPDLDDDDALEETGRSRRRQKQILTQEEVETIPKVLHKRAPMKGAASEEANVDKDGEERDVEQGVPAEEDSACSDALDSSTETCAICIEEYEDGDRLRELPCGHRFHISCIDEWLTKVNSVCPLCKFDIGKHVKNSSADAIRAALSTRSSEPNDDEEAPESSAGLDSSAETPLLGEGRADSSSSRRGLFTRVRRYFYGPTYMVTVTEEH